MFDIVGKYMEEFLGGMVDQTKALIRTEVDYAATTIRSSISDGVKAGLDAIRKTVFYLLIAAVSTIIALVFITWGFAQMFEALFPQQPGLGFVIFGLALLLIGLLSFTMSKPK
jgi:sterol desaturase/sphingolipid hydroxylase (fatty acid hydroxylase superfamily)